MIDIGLTEKIKNISESDKNKLKSILEDISKNIDEKNIYSFKVHAITPLFTGGAKGEMDSIIRATEIKGVLRWFIRYILFADYLDHPDERKRNNYLSLLADIFGNNSKNSFFDIIVTQYENLKYYENAKELIDEINNFSKSKKIKKEDFGHRLKDKSTIEKDNKNSDNKNNNKKKTKINILLKFVKPQSSFNISFIKKRELNNLRTKEKEIFELFKLIIQLFGFGKLYRRGFGKLEIEDMKNGNIKDILMDIKKKIYEIFDINIKIAYSDEKWIDNQRNINIKAFDLENNSKKIEYRDLDNYHIIVHKLGEFNNWEECIAEIANYVKKEGRKFNPKNPLDKYVAMFMGLPRSEKLGKINGNKIPSSVVYTIVKEGNKYTIYSIILTKTKKWKLLRNVRGIGDIMKRALEKGYII